MLRHRVFTAVALLPLVVAGVWWLPPVAFEVAAGGVFLLAAWEWARLVPMASAVSQWTYLAATALLMVALGVGGLLELAPLVGAVGLAWWTVVLFWLGFPGLGGGGGRAGCLAKAVAGWFVLMPAWALVCVLQAEPGGPVWLFLLLALVWAADICAYFAGHRFGRRRLAPRISPGKTWAGVGGAVTAGLVVALLAAPFLAPGWRGAALVFLALVTVAVSIVGDLFESLVKRQANAKDSSSLLPGHGGLFDRLDSLFAAVPVFYWGCVWLRA